MNHELAIERVLDAPVSAIWQAWREHLAEWWCPLPWRTELHALELQAGGRFATTMISPDGERHDDEGLILEAVPAQRVVLTNALLPGWRPQPGNPFPSSDCSSSRPRARARATVRPPAIGRQTTARSTAQWSSKPAGLPSRRSWRQSPAGWPGHRQRHDRCRQANAADPLSC